MFTFMEEAKSSNPKAVGGHYRKLWGSKLLNRYVCANSMILDKCTFRISYFYVWSSHWLLYSYGALS